MYLKSALVWDFTWRCVVISYRRLFPSPPIGSDILATLTLDDGPIGWPETLQEAGWAPGPVWTAENLAPSGLDTQTVQPIVSRYTD